MLKRVMVAELQVKLNNSYACKPKISLKRVMSSKVPPIYLASVLNGSIFDFKYHMTVQLIVFLMLTIAECQKYFCTMSFMVFAESGKLFLAPYEWLKHSLLYRERRLGRLWFEIHTLNY